MNSIQNKSIDGIDYFNKNIEIYLPYIVIYTFGCISGIFSNLLIIVAIITTKDLHNATNMIIFNLSLADLLISGFVDSFTIAGTSFSLYRLKT
jgi:hypothetical protein